MLLTRTHKTISSLLVGVACLALPRVSAAATAVKPPGAIVGKVNNSLGVPQMGAAVQLYSRQDRVLGRVQTDDHGEFKFLGLLPDVYSLRVTLATFFPAFQRNILVQPGMRSVLNVRLSTLFSTIQLSYPTVDNGSLMTDDYKWVLRSAAASRPVLRFTDGLDPAEPTKERVAVFSDTRGLVQVSAGQGTQVTAAGTQADMGTAFVLATSVFGNSLLQVSGNVGYGSQTGVPTAAIRTSYSRSIGGGNPEFSVTMRQLLLPGRTSGVQDFSLPTLRTVSAGFADRAQLSEQAELRYGLAMDSVAFLGRVNYFSPYAQLTYALSPDSDLEFAYTSGDARPDLAGSPEQGADLRNDLDTLGMFPLVSVRSSRARVQRGREYEAAYSYRAGSRTYRVSAYREVVDDAALAMLGASGLADGADTLPDLFSGSSIFNIGDYRNTGYTASMTQNLGDHVSATMMYGTTGALTVDNREVVSNSPDELRSMIRSGRRRAATVRIAATSPWTGTRLVASYQWSGDDRWAVIGNIYSTQAMRPVPGFNLFFRQPIPGFGRRVEATADLRNMLAQGYLPLGMAAGQRLVLVGNPRSVRGGLSFIF